MKFLSFLTLFVLLMQPFTYGFYKALCWQFEGRLKKRGRRLLCLALFAFGNGLRPLQNSFSLPTAET